ncbi:TRAP transporter substrate-binding protein [Rubrobacter taiwanensis]|uniref:TRAP transporter substrate-binding protein n=1 Tax=Rubrobacter taiwanensis TaxID=185139 RepID=A0A4R1BSR5_9ACTN|nr:TRAP transporter substrate-binding protein [Rubrobacter taiwanensis]
MRAACKYVLLVAAAVLTAATLAACGAAGEEEQTLELGHVWPEDDYQAEGVARFAEEVEELTGGSVTVNISPAGQLGGDREILEGLELGTNDMWVGGAGVYNAITPVGQLFPAPFMFDDLDAAAETYDGEIGEEIKQRIEEDTDTVALAFWDRGPRHLTLNSAAEQPEDLAGKRIRVPENPIFIETWRALGASPTPMEFPEVFTALQQGTIDGQENPLALTHSSGFYDVQSHLMLTGHVIEPIAVAISAGAWEGLSEEQQDALVEAANGAAKEEVAQITRDQEEEFRRLLEEEGMTVIEPDREAYREATEGIVEENFPEISDLYNRIVEQR